MEDETHSTNSAQYIAKHLVSELSHQLQQNCQIMNLMWDTKSIYLDTSPIHDSFTIQNNYSRTKIWNKLNHRDLDFKQFFWLSRIMICCFSYIKFTWPKRKVERGYPLVFTWAAIVVQYALIVTVCSSIPNITRSCQKTMFI